MAKRKEKPEGQAVRPAGQAARPGHVKCTMWLPVETWRKVRHAAIEKGLDIGQVVAPPVERELAKCYWVDRSAAPKLGLVELPVAAPPPAGGQGIPPADEAA